MSQQQQQLTTESGQLPTECANEARAPETEHLTSVAESIKYRKRAQTAEQQVQALTQQLKEQQQNQQDIEARLIETQLDTELTRQVVRAGAVDVEAAVLLAKKQYSEKEETDVKLLVEGLRKSRPHLFFETAETAVATLAGPTATIRSRNNGCVSTLSRLAQQAQHSGNRRDMQEYMRLRRSVRNLG